MCTSCAAPLYTSPQAYLPHPFEFYTLLLSATFLNLAATKQLFYKFAHLPLHYSTLTFYHAILPNFYYTCLYATLFNFPTTNHPSTILPIFCHTKLTLTFYFQLHYAICYIPQPQSFHLLANTNLYTLTCCYTICYNVQFCLPETLHFSFSA